MTSVRKHGRKVGDMPKLAQRGLSLLPSNLALSLAEWPSHHVTSLNTKWCSPHHLTLRQNPGSQTGPRRFLSPFPFLEAAISVQLCLTGVILLDCPTSAWDHLLLGSSFQARMPSILPLMATWLSPHLHQGSVTPSFSFGGFGFLALMWYLYVQ